MWVPIRPPTIRRSQVMQVITTIGLDIAKSVFQVGSLRRCGGNVILRRQLKRRYTLVFFQKLPP